MLLMIRIGASFLELLIMDSSTETFRKREHYGSSNVHLLTDTYLRTLDANQPVRKFPDMETYFFVSFISK